MLVSERRVLMVVLVLCHIGVEALSRPIADTMEGEITVTGTAELRLLANRATFTVSVEGFGSSIGGAVQEATTRTDDMVRRLLAMGIKRTDVSTQQFASAAFSGDKPLFSSSKDYQSTIATRVVVDSVQLLGNLVAMLSDAGYTISGTITFSLRDEQETVRELRRSACRVAKDKATELVTELGGKLGRIVSIAEATTKEDDRPRYPSLTSFSNTVQMVVDPPHDQAADKNSKTASESFSTPEMALTSRVTVTYAIPR